MTRAAGAEWTSGLAVVQERVRGAVCPVGTAPAGAGLAGGAAQSGRAQEGLATG